MQQALRYEKKGEEDKVYKLRKACIAWSKHQEHSIAR